MKNESVAILDIRSGEVSFLLGAKGVNNNFAFSGIHSERYDGFSLKGFFDKDDFCRCVMRVIGNVQQNYKGTIDEVYVGVPAALVSVVTKGQTRAFNTKHKLTAQDIEALFDRGMNELAHKGVCIRRSAMYFTLGDNRKYFSAEDLYGIPTTMLKGALSYYYVSGEFYDFITSLLYSMGFNNVKLIPSTLAQSLYLLPKEKREGYAFLLDIGFITSSFSVVYGNGIVHEENYNCGVAGVLVALMEKLKIDFNLAEAILEIANISGEDVPSDLMYSTDGDKRSFRASQVNDIIRCAVDKMCEPITKCVRKYSPDVTFVTITRNPISVTGEGVLGLKGIIEHVTNRVEWVAEMACPDLPYYDKPTVSSRISLLDMAINDQVKNSSFWQRVLRFIGGKKV